MGDEELPVVVIDNGSYEIKAGLAGNDIPQFKLPCMGFRGDADTTHCKQSRISNVDVDLINVGEGVSPIEHGIVQNWDAMTDVWRATYRKLGKSSDEYPVIISESPLNPAINRQMMAQVMFETFNVPKLHIEHTGKLAYLCHGRTFTFCVDIGHTSAITYVIAEGRYMTKCMRRFDLAGHDLTLYLQKLLNQKNYSFSTKRDLHIVQNLKEHSICARIPGVPKEHDSSFKMEDGTVLTLGDERYKCAEALFQPSLLGMENLPGIHQFIHDTYMEADIDFRNHLQFNFCLSGATTLIQGFPERLTYELSQFMPKVKVVARIERENAVWVGGSVLGSLSTFETGCIQRNEYEEYGPNIIYHHGFCSPFF